MTYYIAPQFLDKLAVHITKNFLDLPNVRVPLILGIHGRKGEGKTFQCELVFAKMGFEPVTISGGELESPDAGDPARLIRLRYREAAEQIKVRGQMCALFINDLDAGAGRFDVTTQYTVNTQLVNATLMNIADNPTNVQLPGSYDATPLHRVPIIVTGNDFSTLYAPLIRDGRMEKFYWEPNRDDKIGILGGIFALDGISPQDIEQLIDEFPEQAIDFFSALRSRIYDEQIRSFVHNVGVDQVSKRIVNSKEKPPEFHHPNFTIDRLLAVGHNMVMEQQRVKEMRLVEEYNQYRIAPPVVPHASSGNSSWVNPETATPESGVNTEMGVNKPLTQFVKAETYFRSYNETSSPQKSVVNPQKLVVPGGISEENQGTAGVSNQTESQADKLGAGVLEQVQQIISSGYKLGVEIADKRRFKTGAWQTYGSVESGQEKEAIELLAKCLTEHSNDYIKMMGIDRATKRRVVETIIYRPN